MRPFAVLCFAVFVSVGLAADKPIWYAGGDISALPLLESKGITYAFDGKTKDLIQGTRELGWNMYRLRLFVDPDGKNQRVNTLPYTLALAERVHKAGGVIMLDLHYSDTWADPAHQVRPKAWKDLNFEQLVKKVETYSAEVISAFKKRGVLPRIVQVGNEINHGMLWPDGKLYGDGAGGWPKFAQLVNAGIRGVKKPLAAGDDLRVMIQSASGGNIKMTQHFLANLKKHGVEYDLLGLSHYPWWHDTIPNVRKNLHLTLKDYGKPVMIIECGYPQWGKTWTHGFTDKHMFWPMTPEGQDQYTREIIAAVKSLPNNMGQGVLWWFPESRKTKGLHVWMGGRCGLFNWKGEALPALKTIGASSLD